MCWGEYYKGKWTSPKSTELKKPMVITYLSSFESDKLLIYGRKDIVENPAGKFRERLLFNLRYRGGGGQQKDAVFTFTSKNAPPYLEYTNDSEIYDKLKVGLDTLFFNPYYGTSEPTSLYYTQFSMPGKNLKVNIKQPSGADKDEITENVLTKKDKLTPGFSILPVRHIVENQFEAPLSYADEHSTFFVAPDEETYISVRIYDDYYPIYEVPFLYEDIPVLVVKPIPGWPPEEELQFGEEVVINNPWDWNKESIKTNTNFSKMLPVNDTFNFEGTEFGTAGKNIGTGKINL